MVLWSGISTSQNEFTRNIYNDWGSEMKKSKKKRKNKIKYRGDNIQMIPRSRRNNCKRNEIRKGSKI